jgi:hypothetical protein
MKKRTHIPVESIEKQTFKKNFLERQLQDEDARQQIKEYRHETEESCSLREAPDVAQKREL